jgi:DNA-binding beta-propeller fold protein YncE
MGRVNIRRLAYQIGLPIVLLVLAGACSNRGGDTLTAPSGNTSVAAPDFPGGHTWFNVSRPLTLGDLRGKVVVLDFWTLGCINCQHIVPDLQRLESEFGSQVAVIGVHSGKYDREHSDDSVREAVLRLELKHPVVNDPDFAIWSAYDAHAWPTIVVIDPAGEIVGVHEGEGVYDSIQPAVAELVSEFGGQLDPAPLPIDLEAAPIASDFLSFPGSVLADEAGGRLFIADSGNNRVLVASPGGTLQSAIGSGAAGRADGLASEAQFNQPQGLALSADGGTLYVADTRNHLIRSVDLAAGEVTTIAGTGKRAETFPAEAAEPTSVDLASPWGLELIGEDLYIAMAGAHQIWTMGLATGEVRVAIGSAIEGIADGPAATAQLAQPNQLTSDGTNLYWVDPESSGVRVYSPSSDGVRTLSGTGLFDFGDADGPPAQSKLQHPQGIALANGILYVSDTYNHKIRTVDPVSGVVTTVAGIATPGKADGNAGSATFDEPGGLSFAAGKLFIADTNNNAIRTLDVATGEVATLRLSNLGVASAGSRGRTFKLSLDPQTVSPSTTVLHLRLSAPEGYHLNDLAPSRLALSTSDATAFTPGESEVTFSTNERSVDIAVPVTVSAGQAIVSAVGEVYYCRQEEDAICLVDRLDIALPVTVTAGAQSSEALMQYELPR